MPSPLGHALAGMAAGLLVDRPSPAGVWPRRWLDRPFRRAAVFGVIAVVPDLDLLVGSHSAQTHSVGAVVIAGLVCLAWSGQFRFALAAAAAYASHVLLDWLGRDTSPPLGVMALWPLSSDYYMSPVALLPAVSRRYWEPGFVASTLRVGVQEVLVFGSVAALAWWRHGVRAFGSEPAEPHKPSRNNP